MVNHGAHTASAHRPHAWRLTRAARGALVAVVVVAIVNWVGWATGVDVLTRFNADWPAMTPWTALWLSALSIAVLLQLDAARASPLRVRLARGVALLTGLLGAGVLFEYLSGINLGVDLWWFGGAVSQMDTEFPGRPSPQTAATVVLLACAVMLVRADAAWLRAPWAALLGAGVTIPLVAVLGYLFDAARLLRLNEGTGIALSTALSLLAIASSTAVSRPDRPPVAWLLARPDRVSVIRFILVLAGFPVLIAALLQVLRAVGYSEESRWALALAIATIAVSMMVYAVSLRQQRDITVRLGLLDELAEARDYLASVLDAAVDPHLMLTPIRDSSSRIVDLAYADANPAACTYLNMSLSDLRAATVLGRFGGEPSRKLISWCSTALDHGQPVVLDDQTMVSEITRATAWYDIRAIPVNGAVSFSFRNVTARHTAAAALAASEEKYRLLAQNASDVVMHTRNHLIVWVSPSLTALLGWHAEDWVGSRFDQFIHPEDLAGAVQGRDSIEAGGVRLQRFRIRHRNGQFRWVEIHAAPAMGPDGEIDGIAAAFRGIDAQVQMEQALSLRARYDALTGLLNRAEVFERLREVASERPAPGVNLAVAFCDLDDFKEINDSYGHNMGDHVLRATAAAAKSVVRQGDFVARLGGDEILLALSGVTDLRAAIGIAEEVRRECAKPRFHNGVQYSIRMSIGVTLLREGEGVDALIARADAAMYRAKKAGGGRVVGLL